MPARLRAPVTAHVFLARAGQVLLLRRFQTGYEDGSYSVVAGHLEAGETVLMAARRETQEEVGVKLLEQDLRVVGVMQRKSNDERVDFFLAAPTWEGEVRNAEPDKCDDLIWRALDDLPANTIPYVRRALANYREGRWFDVFGWPEAPGSQPKSMPPDMTLPVIRQAAQADLELWVQRRAALWPREPAGILRQEALKMLQEPERNVCYLAVTLEGEVVGFLEVSLRDWAEGCRSSPVGFLEGWFVDPGWRHRGVGAALVAEGEAWAHRRGCTEMGSDADADNSISWLAHTRLGYQEVERRVGFSKRLKDD
jgi:8-oxo-dGTP diphosphatase